MSLRGEIKECHQKMHMDKEYPEDFVNNILEIFEKRINELKDKQPIKNLNYPTHEIWFDAGITRGMNIVMEMLK